MGLNNGPDIHYKGFAHAPPHLSGLFACDRCGAWPRARGAGHANAVKALLGRDGARDGGSDS
jgi:hypothetical protein